MDFDELRARHRSYLIKGAMKLKPESVSIQEAEQCVEVAIWETTLADVSPELMLTYAYRAMINGLIDEHRGHQFFDHRNHEELIDISSLDEVGYEPKYTDDFEVLIAPLDSEKEKDILRRCYVHGETLEEVGDVYGISEVAIFKARKKALKKLEQHKQI